VAQYASGSQTTDLVGFGLLSYLGVGRVQDVPVPGILMVLLAMLAQALFAWSAPFRRLRAIGANPAASILMGLPASRYVVGAFVVSGMLAGVAAIVISGRLSSASPNAGFGLELAAITAAVLGGTALTGGSGSAIGSLIGALLLATVFNGLILMGFSAFAQQVATGVILAIAVAVNMALRRHSE
jgi:ribose transport system permease protein